MGADSLLNLIFCYALGSRPLLDSRESVRLPLEDSWRASSYNVNKCVALQNFVIMNKLFILWPDKSRFRVDICQGCLWPGFVLRRAFFPAPPVPSHHHRWQIRDQRATNLLCIQTRMIQSLCLCMSSASVSVFLCVCLYGYLSWSFLVYASSTLQAVFFI